MRFSFGENGNIHFELIEKYVGFDCFWKLERFDCVLGMFIKALFIDLT